MKSKKIEDYEHIAVEWLQRDGFGFKESDLIQTIAILVNIDLINSLFRGTYVKQNELNKKEKGK